MNQAPAIMLSVDKKKVKLNHLRNFEILNLDHELGRVHHKSLSSTREGLGFLMEALDDLREKMRDYNEKQSFFNREQMQAMALKLAARALQFSQDLCEDKPVLRRLGIANYMEDL